MSEASQLRKRVRLGELLKVKHGFAFKGDGFTEPTGDIVLTPGNFLASGGLVFRPEKDRSYSGAYPREFRFAAGDLVVVMTDLTQEARILGAAAFVPPQPGCLHNQRLGKIIDLDTSRIDHRYLYFVLNERTFRESVKATATGSTVRHTSPGRIQAFEFSLPPLGEQRRIASILGAYDDLIEVNRRRIAVLEEMARRLFEEWFVHFRFSGEALASTPGELPSSWSWQLMSAVCVPGDGIQTGPFGSQLHQADYSDDGVPVVMPKNIVGMRILEDGIARIPERLAKELGRHLMAAGDVVYGRRGDIGRRAFISRREGGWFCGTGCLRLRPDPARIHPRYFFDALGVERTFGEIKARAQGATMPNLSAGVMAAVPILVPPLALQQRYGEAAEQLSDLAASLHDANDRLAASRDLVLPRLICGDLPVTAAERELEAVA